MFAPKKAEITRKFHGLLLINIRKYARDRAKFHERFECGGVELAVFL
jgi:hypothetical protein